MFCPHCGTLLTRKPTGFICRKESCPSRRFDLFCLVKDRKNPQFGIGRISEDKKNHFIVSFRSGDQEVFRDDLERAILEAGTQVKTKDSQGVVTGHSSVSGKFFYQVMFPTGKKNIQEQGIEEIVPSSPMERLNNGDVDPPQTFVLTILAKYFQIAQKSEDLVCIRNSRVDLLPHQVGIAHRVVQEYSPRYILADEVGLGKTMEAGLIMKELKSRGLVKRVLIITPASLVTQWQHEMRSKFNERFEILDSRSEIVHQTNHPDRDVLSLHDNVLCSIHYAKTRAGEFSAQFWDLIIFDEAHHLRRYLVGNDETKSTQNYKLASALRDRCGAMLLLTATPMQLDPFEFYSLIELIDPSLFKNYRDFEKYNDEFGLEIKHMLGKIREKQNILLHDADTILQVNYLLAKGKQLFPQYHISDPAEYTIVKQLQNYLVISKLMIRNRKRDVIKNLMKRKVTNLAVEYTRDEMCLYKEISEYIRTEYSRSVREKNPIIGFAMVIFQKMLTSSKFTLLKSLKKRLGISYTEIDISRMAKDEEEFDELDEEEQEAEIDSLISFAGRSHADKELLKICEKIEKFGYDSKINRLSEAIDAIFSDHPKEKALIFTQFIASQDYLKAILSKKYSVVTFNGRMSKEEKDEKAESFRRSAQIMISTEAGGEGRNFQFCHILFNFDLPWNPMKLEQRIGRLDRIGQKKHVMVYNFTTIDTVEQRVLDVLYERVDKFRDTIGDMEPILGELERDVKKVIMAQHADLDEEIGRLEKSIDNKLEEARYIQTKMQDFVMDKQQFNYETVEQILGKKPAVTPEDLRDFVKAALLHLGESSKFEENGKIYSIHLPFGYKRSKCSQTKFEGTFDPDFARENENTEFIAFGHELVTELLSHFSAPDEPVCTVFHDIRIKPGCLFLFMIETESLITKQVFLPVFIDDNYIPDPGIGNKCMTILKEYLRTEIPPPGFDPFDIDDHYRLAEEIVGQHIEQESGKTEKLRGDLIIRETARIERLHNFRMSKLGGELQSEKTRYERISRSTEKEKKILPALHGRIRAIEERIKAEQAETNTDLDKLQSRSELKVSYALFGIARFV